MHQIVNQLCGVCCQFRFAYEYHSQCPLFLDKPAGSVHSQQSNIVTGKGLGSLGGEQEAQNIHKENLEKLQSMSQEQILEEQKRLLAQLGTNFLLTSVHLIQ